MKKTLIEEMSWAEFQEAMRESDLIVFPVGSLEEHGPHNPLGTDFLIARAAAKAVGERVGAPVTPVMPFGYAANLTCFPGTASIDLQLLRSVLTSVCESFIRHGARRFLFINGHGGNTAALRLVGLDLHEKHGAICSYTQWWNILPQIRPEWPCDDHGGYYETSLMMALDAGLVDLSRADNRPYQNLTGRIAHKHGGMTYAGATIDVPLSVDKLTPLGNFGGRNPKEADPELGRRMFEAYVDYCAGLAGELRKIQF